MKTLHIICFGDSLTVGYQSPTAEHAQIRETPYGAFLQDALGDRATVVLRGINGERTGDMVARFARDALNHQASHVIILGGTNDLGWGAAPEPIMDNLRTMYTLARSADVEPVAVTVPSIRIPGGMEGPGEGESRKYIAQRLRLNGLIQAYCASNGQACIDLFSATAEPDSLVLLERYSNDGLHLTTQGYQHLADLLCAQVFSPPSHSGTHP